MREFIATYKDSRQISIDDWDVFNPTLKVTEETTVKEILDWYRGGSLMEVKLIELQTIAPKQDPKMPDYMPPLSELFEGLNPNKI